MDILKIVLGRIIAAILAGFFTWLASKYNIIFTDAEKAQITTGVISLALTIFMILYAIFHKTIDRWLNPGDAASKMLLRQESTEQDMHDRRQ